MPPKASSPGLIRIGCREFTAAFFLAIIFSAGLLYNVGIGHGSDSELVCVESTAELDASHDTCVNACKDAFDTCAGACTITDSFCVGTCGAVNDVCISDCVDDDAQNNLAVRNACTRSLPVWVLAGVVGVGVYAVYLIVAAIFAPLVEGTAFVSAVHFGLNVAHSKVVTRNYEFGRALMAFLFSLLAQTLGSGAGVVIVYLFAGTKINQIQNVYQNNLGWPDKFEPTGTQVARALVCEAIGALILSLVLLASANGGSNDNRRARFMGVFYFVYVALFWVHTKFTLDAIRGGWMCIVAVADDDSTNCSAKGGAPMVLWLSLVHVGMLVVSFVLGYFLYHTTSKTEKS